MSSPFGSAYPPPENPFQPSASLSPPPRSRSWIWLLVGGVLGCMCLCSGLCIVPVGLGVYQAATERDDVELVVTGFLAEMDDGRFEQAASRFSTRASEAGSIDAQALARLRDGNTALQDATAAHVATINVSRVFNSNRKVAQGNVANVNGTVDYQCGSQGRFRATLEKERGEWRLHSINVQRGATATANVTP